MPDGGADRQPAAALDLADIRFRRAVAQLHALGPRVVTELLEEIGGRYLIRQPIEATVERYIKLLDPVALAITGGNRPPPAPIRLAPRAPR